jgi:hypothetical protein
MVRRIRQECLAFRFDSQDRVFSQTEMGYGAMTRRSPTNLME